MQVLCFDGFLVVKEGGGGGGGHMYVAEADLSFFSPQYILFTLVKH